MRKTSLESNYLVESLRRQFGDTRIDNEIKSVISDKKDYLAVTFSIQPIDVLAALEQICNDSDFQYYWEKPANEFSMAGGGELKRIVHSGEQRFRNSSTDGKSLLSTVHHVRSQEHSKAEVHLLGGFSFFDENNSIVWENFKASSFTLPKWMIIREGKFTLLTVTIAVDENATEESLKNNLFEETSKLESICNVDEYSVEAYQENKKSFQVNTDTEFDHIHWIESVNRAKREIFNGNFDKVVLARELRLELPTSVKDTVILHRLRRQYPDCYCFLIRQDENASFIGCTPERLASFQSNFILTEGLAGSASRGKSATEDAIMENDLLNSSKDLHEHEIVLEAINSRLSPFSESIRHPGTPSVKKLSNVQHLYTPITATIKEGVSRTEVLKSLHPTPAVGGYPSKEAVNFIRKHEDFDRGWYAAPIGWINAAGNGEFAVAIRSGLIMDNEVRFFAGCGIVQDSDPQKEWEETNMKFIPMLSALEYAGS